MIPKVAHILQQTTRAAAAVHAQTQSLRNALQFQGQPSANSLNSWASTPGSSSSSYGSTGGAKQNAGGKFYSHTQTNVNQANSASSHGAANQDDVEEYKKRITVLRRQPQQLLQPRPASPPKHRKRRRSSSLSSGSTLLLQSEPGTSLGVLDAVQLYAARHKHALVEASVLEIELPASPRQSVRRNSMSSAPPAEDRALDPPESEEVIAAVKDESDEALAAAVGAENEVDLSAETSVVDIDSEIESLPEDSLSSSAEAESVSTQATEYTDLGVTQADEGKFDPVLLQELRVALVNRNKPRITQLVKQLRTAGPLDVSFFNIALRAAEASRYPGQPLGPFIAVYNEMISSSVRPNDETYRILISAFCDRDFEVFCALQSLNRRITVRELTNKVGTANDNMDNLTLERIRREETMHFHSAVELFNIIAPRFWKLSTHTYMQLLRACSVHGDVDQAIKVYAHYEKMFISRTTPSPTIYYHLLGAFLHSNDPTGAHEVFAEYKANAAKGLTLSARKHRDSDNARRMHTRIYNRMLDVYMAAGQPERAVALLEQMITDHGKGEFTGAEVPPPNARSFSTVINGFATHADIDSALAWHNRLVQQPNGPTGDREASQFEPVRPDDVMWADMLYELARAGPPHIDKLNAYWLDFVRCAELDGVTIRMVDKHIVMAANIRALQQLDISSPQFTALCDFVAEKVVPVQGAVADTWIMVNYMSMRGTGLEFVDLLARAQRPGVAIEAAYVLEQQERIIREYYQEKGAINSDDVARQIVHVRQFVQDVTNAVIQNCGDTLGLVDAVNLGVLRKDATISQRHDVTIATLRAYAAAVEAGAVPVLESRQWDSILSAAVVYHEWNDGAPKGLERAIPPPDFAQILADLNAQELDVRTLFFRKRFVMTMVAMHGADGAREIINSVYQPHDISGEVLRNLIVRANQAAQMLDSVTNAEEELVLPANEPQAKIDMYHSRTVEEYYPSHPTLTALDGYKRFEQGMVGNIYPTPEAIGRLIGVLGRQGEMDKVRVLYNAAQVVLASLEKTNKDWQTRGWYHTEDQMIVAFAHGGDIAAAQIHRERILKYHGVPSADAYGALIQATKDTTDDVAPALSLWEESQKLGVRAHIFLYNTIISKLAKARKVDHALALFSKMKQQGVRPSSVTYGAMISACARVGDAISAEHLFQEMQNMGNFKPRIPPFNTMMQMYTYTQPDRARVLAYYEQLRATGIAPNSHTYKVLMDAYGTIQPVDFASLQNVFDALCTDPKVGVNGSHWSSLITAHGCIGGDVDRAISIFESISEHPSSLRSPRVMPDAVSYEALINVFVTHRRNDLIPLYMQRLKESGVHMTAYIANLLIKGYAAMGEIGRSREVFESMADAPDGVAAPNNHVPHGEGAMGGRSSPAPDEPVYREPSTWEAMVRAELAHGDSTLVDSLLARMESRRYPPGVINRIRGILTGNDVPELGAPIMGLHAALGMDVNRQGTGHNLYQSAPVMGTYFKTSPPPPPSSSLR